MVFSKILFILTILVRANVVKSYLVSELILALTLIVTFGFIGGGYDYNTVEFDY